MKDVFFVATEDGMYRSENDDIHWRRVSRLSGPCSGLVVLATRVFAAYADGIYQSQDAGVSWNQAYNGRGNKVLALAGGYVTGSRMVVLAAVRGTGIVGSENMGRSWSTLVGEADIEDVVMAPDQTHVAFAATSQDVLKTEDGGGKWTQCFVAAAPVNESNTVRAWPHLELNLPVRIAPNSLGVNPSVPSCVMLTTGPALYVSRNSGGSWSQAVNRLLPRIPFEPGVSYGSNGLDANTPWEYYIDPTRKRLTYIAYSDTGFCRSPDRGTSWTPVVNGSPWTRCFYDVVFDPFTPGRIYAAAADQPDIPAWNQIDHVEGSGGVIVSDDFAGKWRETGSGLPKKPCTSLAVGTDSSKGALILYAAVFGDGVYKSADSGKTWTRKSQGLGREENMHVFMIRVQNETGDIYCSVTGSRDADQFKVPGGLWRSTDGAETWQELTAQLNLFWPGGFAFDPRDPNVVYLAASSVPGNAQGGVYKSADRGRTWTRLRSDEDFSSARFIASWAGEPFQAWFVSVSPHNPDRVYLSTITSGLWLSQDAGKTWSPVDWVAFPAVTRICFPPVDIRTIYVSTFGGGVWKGPAAVGEPAGAEEDQ